MPKTGFGTKNFSPVDRVVMQSPLFDLGSMEIKAPPQQEPPDPAEPVTEPEPELTPKPAENKSRLEMIYDEMRERRLASENDPVIQSLKEKVKSGLSEFIESDEKANAIERGIAELDQISQAYDLDTPRRIRQMTESLVKRRQMLMNQVSAPVRRRSLIEGDGLTDSLFKGLQFWISGPPISDVYATRATDYIKQEAKKNFENRLLEKSDLMKTYKAMGDSINDYRAAESDFIKKVMSVQAQRFKYIAERETDMEKKQKALALVQELEGGINDQIKEEAKVAKDVSMEEDRFAKRELAEQRQKSADLYRKQRLELDQKEFALKESQSQLKSVEDSHKSEMQELKKYETKLRIADRLEKQRVKEESRSAILEMPGKEGPVRAKIKFRTPELRKAMISDNKFEDIREVSGNMDTLDQMLNLSSRLKGNLPGMVEGKFFTTDAATSARKIVKSTATFFKAMYRSQIDKGPLTKDEQKWLTEAAGIGFNYSMFSGVSEKVIRGLAYAWADTMYKRALDSMAPGETKERQLKYLDNVRKKYFSQERQDQLKMEGET